MNVKQYAFAGGLVVLAGALIFFYVLFHRPETVRQAPNGATTPRSVAADTTRLRQVYLYFSGPDHTFLVAESRELTDSAVPSELGKSIVQALVEGPRADGIRTLPSQTVVRDVFITDDGTAYVDFSKAVTEDHPGGVQAELVGIYSVVNSLVLNLEEISAVKFLIAGEEADTLAGHLDLRFPYKADILLIK